MGQPNPTFNKGQYRFFLAQIRVSSPHYSLSPIPFINTLRPSHHSFSLLPPQSLVIFSHTVFDLGFAYVFCVCLILFQFMRQNTDYHCSKSCEHWVWADAIVIPFLQFLCALFCFHFSSYCRVGKFLCYSYSILCSNFLTMFWIFLLLNRVFK
jgi:hypothetical protein